MGSVSRGAAPDAKVAFTDLGNGTTNQIQTRQVRWGHFVICGRLKTHWSDVPWCLHVRCMVCHVCSGLPARHADLACGAGLAAMVTVDCRSGRCIWQGTFSVV